MMFLQCVGEAIVAQGMRGLMGMVPMGEQLFNVSKDAIERYRKARREKKIKEDAEKVIQARLDEVREEAKRIAHEVAAGLSEEEIIQLELYLAQIPAVARQSLKRPADPSGTTIPAAFNLENPIELAALLPRRAPRFRMGEQVPHAAEWKFQELLGSGGFGEVWLARHSFLDQFRAFKFCLDPTSRDRLLRHEGEVVKRVMKASTAVKENESGVVPLVGAYLDGEAPWLAYEYVDGGDLSAVARELAVTPAQARGKLAIEVLADLAQVIGRFHTLPHPIIHRDLKPANILVKKFGSRWLLRVTDFGISHVTADQSIRQASISTPSLHLGETFRGAHTPIYASPQQKKGLDPDVRDDVYALGIIGYQLLLGDLSAERPSSKWRKRIALCETPDDVLNVLENAWDDEANERAANARVMADALSEKQKREQESALKARQAAEEEKRKQEERKRADIERRQAEADRKSEAERKRQQEEHRRMQQEAQRLHEQEELQRQERARQAALRKEERKEKRRTFLRVSLTIIVLVACVGLLIWLPVQRII